MAATPLSLLISGSLERLASCRRAIVAAMLFGMLMPATASAYIGPSFLQLPDVAGGWATEPFKGWIRANSNVWRPGRGILAFTNYEIFAGPPAPREGAGTLVVAIDKSSPAVARMMEKCLKKTAIPEVTYAESSTLAGGSDIGERPAQMPEYFQYGLKDVHISDCPVVAGAPEQAFVLSYGAIRWLNYDQAPKGLPVVLKPVPLQPQADTAHTRSFVLTWLGVANDVSDDQCSTWADKPSQEKYYTYLSKEEVAQERVRLAAKGGPQNAEMEQRGPNKLDVTRLPGIVPDPGQPHPRPGIARGLDLDGKPGVDNRYFEAMGCVPGYRGRQGFWPQFVNSQMRDGEYSALVEVSGIDDPRNDDSVDITWFYSTDPMFKNGAGTEILRDFTFRAANTPQLAPYSARMHGRIVNGVVVSDAVDSLDVYFGKFGLPAAKRLFKARMQLEFQPDGTVKGILAGYMDVWAVVSRHSTAISEGYYDYEVPAVYNALRRAADGLKDPVTGEYKGISIAYDIEGLPAFVATSPAPKLADKQGQTSIPSRP